uniref:Astacin domain-containing protein n=1 Tax=Steinernema glaseri TaxID=37863 RepID=A0A1I7YX27_9BILA
MTSLDYYYDFYHVFFSSNLPTSFFFLLTFLKVQSRTKGHWEEIHYALFRSGQPCNHAKKQSMIIKAYRTGTSSSFWSPSPGMNPHWTVGFIKTREPTYATNMAGGCGSINEQQGPRETKCGANGSREISHLADAWPVSRKTIP